MTDPHWITQPITFTETAIVLVWAAVGVSIGWAVTLWRHRRATHDTTKVQVI